MTEAQSQMQKVLSVKELKELLSKRGRKLNGVVFGEATPWAFLGDLSVFHQKISFFRNQFKFSSNFIWLREKNFRLAKNNWQISLVLPSNSCWFVAHGVLTRHMASSKMFWCFSAHEISTKVYSVASTITEIASNWYVTQTYLGIISFEAGRGKTCKTPSSRKPLFFWAGKGITTGELLLEMHWRYTMVLVERSHSLL